MSLFSTSIIDNIVEGNRYYNHTLSIHLLDHLICNDESNIISIWAKSIKKLGILPNSIITFILNKDKLSTHLISKVTISYYINPLEAPVPSIEYSTSRSYIQNMVHEFRSLAPYGADILDSATSKHKATAVLITMNSKFIPSNTVTFHTTIGGFYSDVCSEEPAIRITVREYCGRFLCTVPTEAYYTETTRLKYAEGNSSEILPPPGLSKEDLQEWRWVRDSEAEQDFRKNISSMIEDGTYRGSGYDSECN